MMQTSFWSVAGIVLSVLAPGTGHLLEGKWVRGAGWLAGVFAGGAFIYYLFPALEISYYSAFGVLMAVLATRDLIMGRRSRAEHAEPTILKPDA